MAEIRSPDTWPNGAPPTRDDVLAALRGCKATLAERFGVEELTLFGSFARDGARVERPKRRAFAMEHGAKQVDVDEAHAATHEAPRFDGFQNFLVGALRQRRQSASGAQSLKAVGKGAACELADDHRVRQRLVGGQKLRQSGVRGAQTIDPHRYIDEDHAAAPLRRRGMSAMSGWLPPASIGLRAASAPSTNGASMSAKAASTAAAKSASIS